MKKFILPLLVIILIGAIGYFLRHPLFANRGVLEITTTPSTIVIINEKEMGPTPFKGEFAPQKLEVKLLADDSDKITLWQGAVPISSSTLTIVKYTFEENELANYGEILFFNKIPDKKTGALLISSYPDKAVINLDGEIKGYAPILLEKISPGPHTLELNLSGYNNTILGINIAAGFQLNVEVKLPQEEKSEDENENLATANSNQENMVTILSTPTGWLRVRNGPGTGFEEIAKVAPGEQYLLLEENGSWLKIKIDEETQGWISASYSQINEDKADAAN
jgi:hypothetical protein